MTKRFKELQKRPAAELPKELAKLRMDLMRLRTQAAAGSAGKDAGKIRATRRQIARIQTLMRREVVTMKNLKEVPEKR